MSESDSKSAATSILLILLVIVILLGSGATFIGWRRAAIERDRARQVEAMALEARMQAEIERARAEKVSEFLRDTMVGADTGDQHKVTVKELLDSASKRIEQGVLKDSPEARATLHASLGQAYRNLGDLDTGETSPCRAGSPYQDSRPGPYRRSEGPRGPRRIAQGTRQVEEAS